MNKTPNTKLVNVGIVLGALASVACIAYAILSAHPANLVASAPPVPASPLAALPAPEVLDEKGDNIAWFLEWAMPVQLAKLDGSLDEALGTTAHWSHFGTGAEMSEAMLAGEVDIAYSQGLTPFATAVNAGIPITMVGIAVAYSSNDDCIVRDDAGIDASNAAELEGKSVAVPVNTISDFSFRMTMDALGVDVEAITVHDRDPVEGAAALVKGEVVMACGFGAESLAKMKTVGGSMLTSVEKIDAGITSFDIISVRDEFLRKHPDRVRAFLRVTHEANAVFAENPSRIDVLAADSGLTVESTKQQLAGFDFPSVQQQQDRYFGEKGLVLDMLGFVGNLFATDDAPALDDYSVVVNSSLLN